MSVWNKIWWRYALLGLLIANILPIIAGSCFLGEGGEPSICTWFWNIYDYLTFPFLGLVTGAIIGLIRQGFISSE